MNAGQYYTEICDGNEKLPGWEKRIACEYNSDGCVSVI